MNGRRHHPNGSLLLACLTALSFLCVDCAEWFITGVRFLMKLQHERTKPYYSATLCIHIMFALITQSSHLLACASAPPNSFHLARQTIMVQYVCVCVCVFHTVVSYCSCRFDSYSLLVLCAALITRRTEVYMSFAFVIITIIVAIASVSRDSNYR